MPEDALRLRRVTAIFACAALVACSDSVTASSDPDIVVYESATARVITVPVRTSQIRIAFDPSHPQPVAVVSYTRDEVPISELLFLGTEVFPVVARITMCDIGITAPANQLLPDVGDTTIPLHC